MLFSKISVYLPDGSILKDAYVGTERDEISYVGIEKPLREYGPVYQGRGKLLLPGFVNTHCHIPMTVLRGSGADLPLARWLSEAIFPLEDSLTPDEVYWGAMAGIAELLRCGVTSFSDMYFYSQEIAKAVLKTGIKANLSLDENKALRETGGFKDAKAFYQQWHQAGNGRILVDMCIHSEYTTSPEGVRAVAEFAQEHQTQLQLHLSETVQENEACYSRHGKTPAVYFSELGALTPRTTAAHCVHLTPQDMAVIKENRVTVSHCPVSNLKLGSGIADVAGMLEKGIAVSLGTDGAASNDNLNFLEEIKITPLLQKGYRRNPELVSVKDVLFMASRAGALAQGRHDTGFIEQGKRADLIVVDCSSINMAASSDKASAVIYSASFPDIKLTMVDGRVLYENGRYKTLDLELVRAQNQKIAERLHALQV